MPVPASLSPDGRAMPGRWRGWWEGVLDLVPDGRVGNGRRERHLSLEKVFGRNVPKAFPEAAESTLRYIMPNEAAMTVLPEGEHKQVWLDGRRREVVEWDLKDPELQGKDILFAWNGEHEFIYRESGTRRSRSRYIAIWESLTPH